jgi:hypothetical protein
LDKYEHEATSKVLLRLSPYRDALLMQFAKLRWTLVVLTVAQRALQGAAGDVKIGIHGIQTMLQDSVGPKVAASQCDDFQAQV